MKKLGLLVTVTAKTGKENTVSDFLKSAIDLANQESKTLSWYSFQMDSSTFGVFDTFENEEDRDAHLSGEIAKALMANASDLFSESPKIQKIDILSSK